VALNGTRKAALLLMSLDPAAAGELLKSVRPESVTEIAAELACLGAATEPDDAAEPIQEFFSLLDRPRGQGLEDFLEAVLENAMGEQRSREVLQEVQQRVRARDPFRDIRSAAAGDIAKAMAGESPQVVALVLSELPHRKSAVVLSLLEETLRAAAVCGMVAGAIVSVDTRQRVANIVQRRLDDLARDRQQMPGGDEEGEGRLRQLAMLLRGLKKDDRDGLLKVLSEKDPEAGASIQNLMVVWEDLPSVADRACQEILRRVEARTLALALADASGAVTEKVRTNISERAGAMLDEEASLLSSPKPDEIEEAREEIMGGFRELNAAGELTFEDSE